jgi:hypothetical protein
VLCVAALAAAFHPVAAAPIPVRFAEGVAHGFLVLRDTGGRVLAQGDLLQSPRGTEVDKRMVFHFKDGSVFDEHVVFTQVGVYAMKSYKLTQKGPAFAKDTEVAMEAASGAYRVATTDHSGGKEQVIAGTLTLPADVCNGLLLTVIKDLAKGSGEIVHFVGFTPQPRIIEIEIRSGGRARDPRRRAQRQAMHYLLKPRLGAWLTGVRNALRTRAARSPRLDPDRTTSPPSSVSKDRSRPRGRSGRSS